MKQNKIFLTGGHGGTTALATAEILKKHNLKLFWLGPKYAHEGQTALSFEFKTFPQEGIKCLPVRSGRMQRKLTSQTFKSLIRTPIGFWDSFRFILKYRPNLILSYGGFASFPVCFMAWLFGKPVVVHEQTTEAGLANRLTAPFASKIALARRTSLKYFPIDKSVVLGNPIRQIIVKISAPEKLNKQPVIFVMGGSRGSIWINNALKSILPSLLKKYRIIHQTGDLDYERFKTLRSKLENNENYEIYKFLNERNLAKVYASAHLVISRAGANTIAEILALKIPSIMIPIPWVQKDEQTKNASLVVEAGFGTILPQDELGPENLKKAIVRTFENWQNLKTKALKYNSVDDKAAQKLVELVLEYISEL